MAGTESKRPRQHERHMKAIRWVIVLFCVAAIALHVRFPDIKVDSVTLWLLALLLVAFASPAIRNLAPYIRRLRVGSFEVELGEQITKLAAKVDEAEEEVGRAGRPVADRAAVEAGVASIVRDAGSDPRGALLLLHADIETALRDLAEKAGIEGASRPGSVRRLAETLARENLISPSVLSALADLWAIRNRVTHEARFDVSPGTLYSLISLGTEVLTVIRSSSPDTAR